MTYNEWRDRLEASRPAVNRCIDSDPIWQAKRNTSFLEARWWNTEWALLHAALAHQMANGIESRPRLLEYIAGYCGRAGITFNPQWTPFDVDDLPRCPACNEPLPLYQFGRPAKYCNDACKMKAYRQRCVTKVSEVHHATVSM